MKTNYAYQYELSDKSKGYWLTRIKPDKAGYALPSRFPGRYVILIKWVNK